MHAPEGAKRLPAHGPVIHNGVDRRTSHATRSPAHASGADSKAMAHAPRARGELVDRDGSTQPLVAPCQSDKRRVGLHEGDHGVKDEVEREGHSSSSSSSRLSFIALVWIFFSRAEAPAPRLLVKRLRHDIHLLVRGSVEQRAKRAVYHIVAPLHIVALTPAHRVVAPS